MAINRRAVVQAAGAGALLAPFVQGFAASATPSRLLSAQPSNTEIVALDANALSAAILNRDVSCAEVMSACLEQIDRFNPAFNAIVSRAPAEALMRAANEADAELARGKPRGWMHGFPVAIKDLANAEGFVTSSGSPLYRERVAVADSVHVARMKAAGAIVIGKTNVPEFGLGSQSYNPLFGATGSAYDRDRTAGGSSGGAASALALRMVPLADGSDFMGSLRNPGAFNNVIGFRPTPGVVPLGTHLGEALACNGPMARTVADAARLLATMAGYDASSPASLPTQAAVYAGGLARDWKGARIGWLGDFDGYLPTEAGLLPLCESALDGFRAMGATVEAARVDFDMAELWQIWLVYRHWMNRARRLKLYEDPETRKHLKPEVVWEIEGGADLTGDDVNQAIAGRGRWFAAVQAAFEHFDALVWPTAQVFPFSHEIPWPRQIGERRMDTYHRWMEIVIPGTLAGCPVLNVPAGFSPAGLPMGLQVMLPRYQDFKTLQLGYAYEQTTRWNLDYPPPALTA